VLAAEGLELGWLLIGTEKTSALNGDRKSVPFNKVNAPLAIDLGFYERPPGLNAFGAGSPGTVCLPSIYPQEHPARLAHVGVYHAALEFIGTPPIHETWNEVVLVDVPLKRGFPLHFWSEDGNGILGTEELQVFIRLRPVPSMIHEHGFKSLIGIARFHALVQKVQVEGNAVHAATEGKIC
jgi:hypothetical protein